MNPIEAFQIILEPFGSVEVAAFVDDADGGIDLLALDIVGLDALGRHFDMR